MGPVMYATEDVQALRQRARPNSQRQQRQCSQPLRSTLILGKDRAAKENRADTLSPCRARSWRPSESRRPRARPSSHQRQEHQRSRHLLRPRHPRSQLRRSARRPLERPIRRRPARSPHQWCSAARRAQVLQRQAAAMPARQVHPRSARQLQACATAPPVACSRGILPAAMHRSVACSCCRRRRGPRHGCRLAPLW